MIKNKHSSQPDFTLNIDIFCFYRAFLSFSFFTLIELNKIILQGFKGKNEIICVNTYN